MLKVYLRELFVPAFAVVFFSALIFFGAFYASHVHTRWRCNTFSEVSGVPTKYIFGDTCYVKADGRFIRYSEYEKRATAQNLKNSD